MLEGFDVSENAGGPDRAITLRVGGVPISYALRADMEQLPRSEHPPVLSGAEIFR